MLPESHEHDAHVPPSQLGKRAKTADVTPGGAPPFGTPVNASPPESDYIFSSDDDLKQLLSGSKDTLADLMLQCGFVTDVEDLKGVHIPLLKVAAVRLKGTVSATSYDETSARWTLTDLIVTSDNPFQTPPAAASTGTGA